MAIRDYPAQKSIAEFEKVFFSTFDLV